MIIHGHTLPDKCPNDCPHKGEIDQLLMLSSCFRCPVFLVRGDMLSKSDVHPGLAKGWAEFFRGLNNVSKTKKT
jgi:hypothetical protein